MIPVANPGAAYARLRPELEAAMRRVMESGRYVLGPEVEAFEREFAAHCQAREAVGVASGTEALWLALRALSIGTGDEVVVPALTASATVAGVVEAGAVPVFADVRPADFSLDPEAAEAYLTPRTRAVVAVHLYGNPAPMPGLAALCSAHGLALVEDCAQAHGAQLAGRPVGTWGAAAAWSFYPTKNLGAFGDGGMVTTSEPATAERLRLLRQYSWQRRYESALHGWNSRLDELQAALLRVRLKHLAEDNARRRAIARRYRAALPVEMLGPCAAEGGEGVEHLFVIRHPQRDALAQRLAQRGVGTAVHYPVPCHLQPAYERYGRGPGSLPVAEQAAREVLSLPMYPELRDEEVEEVIEAVRASV